MLTPCIIQRLVPLDSGCHAWQRNSSCTGRHGDRRTLQAQVGGLDQPALLQNQCALHSVVQLTDITWPGVREQRLAGRVTQLYVGHVQLGRMAPQQALGQGQDIRRTLAQRQPGQREH